MAKVEVEGLIEREGDSVVVESDLNYVCQEKTKEVSGQVDSRCPGYLGL